MKNKKELRGLEEIKAPDKFEDDAVMDYYDRKCSAEIYKTPILDFFADTQNRPSTGRRSIGSQSCSPEPPDLKPRVSDPRPSLLEMLIAPPSDH